MKKGLIKASLISFFLLSILGIVLFSLFSSAYSSDKTYTVGEEINIPLGQEIDYTLRVVSPTEEFVTKGIGDSIYYIPREVGVYEFYISYNGISERYSFNVEGKKEYIAPTQDQIISINSIDSERYISSELLNEGYQISGQVEIDKPVKWENSENISSEEKFTPAPQTKEESKGELEKDIVVYSEENISYEDVLVHSEVEEIVKVGEEDKIKVYWEENESYINFEAKDNDNDSYIDEVQWIVPDLFNEQNFNIIIISKAEHLSSDRTFISDIYEMVRELDNVWSETINSNEYVRITFEKNLTNKNDITIFPRVISGSPSIDVYEKDKTELIAKFETISSNQYNKIFLTNLKGEQDTFDLRVIGGAVEFDHIVDPQANDSSNRIYQCGTLDNPGTYVLNQSITSAGSCLNITSSNVYINCNGSTITYGTDGGPGIAGINASTKTYSNISIKGCFITKASSAGTDGYGIMFNRTSNSIIFNNTIRTNGTGNNYGVYISINSYENNITQNVIFSKGTTTNNFGIYLNRGATNTTVSFNNISTNGTATNYGIYAIGNSTSSNNNNLISYNNITTWGIGASNYGIYITSNSSLNNITSNNITSRGTTTNHGIYLVGTAPLTVNNNIISSNFIQTLGTTTNNFGIYLLTNANQNDVTNNTINPRGTSGNVGIAISGATNASLGNELSYNTIRTLGTTTTNYGIYILTNSSNNNISSNDIMSNGTTTSYGIYLVGAAGTLVNNNSMDNNTIKTQCSAASSACHGIYIQNNANYNNVTNNNINTNGTTTNHGIYLFGTAPLIVNNNIISSNNIHTNGIGASNYGIYLLTNANQNDITNNTINTNGTSGNVGITISGATNASMGNELSYNTIRTLGTTTTNYGIYILTNSSNNNVSSNDIMSNGTTTSYGIYLVGAAGTLVNNNSMDNNTIKTQCSAASSACHGIYIQNNANYNNVTNNNINTNGTTTNHGIYLFGTTTINVNYNIIDSNNISTAGIGPSNYGIYLTANVSNNNITWNNILANGTTTNYGIYLLGAAGGALVSNNIVTNNTIQVYGTAGAISNYGIFIRNNANQNSLINNNITVRGTTANYGIYLYGTAPLTVNNNIVSANFVQTLGTTTANYGIYLLTNANQNDVTNNTVNVTGTSGNVGVYISGITNTSLGNELSYNTITTLGRTTANYGIYLTTNASNNNITGNGIFTNGTTTSYGAYLLGITNAPVDNNTFEGNTINTNCSAASSNCHGVYIQNNADSNNVTNNNIITHGTTANYGIYLYGTAVLGVNLNLIDSNTISTDSLLDNGIYLSSYSNSTINSNIINVSKADRIVINSSVSDNNLTNNLFINRNYSCNDVNFTYAGNNGTRFIDQYLENYSFKDMGGRISVKNSLYGEISFIFAVNKSGGNFSNDIQILNNSVYVNSAQTGLNRSANITLYNLPVNFVNPVILKAGLNCPLGSCYNFTSLNAGEVKFNVSSWSNYSIGEYHTEYPQFSNYWDNNGSLIGNGIGLFNVTVESTNGTVLLEINNTNITATNLTSNIYNVSYNFSSAGTYSYKWHSWGDGAGKLYNFSETRSYTIEVPNFPPSVTIDFPFGETFDQYAPITFAINATDLDGINSVIAQIDHPFLSSENITLSNLSSSDNFNSNTIETLWNVEGDSVGINQNCVADIDSSFAGEAYTSILGNGEPNTDTYCSLVSTNPIYKDFDMNISFNVTSETGSDYAMLFKLTEVSSSLNASKNMFLSIGNWTGYGRTYDVFINDGNISSYFAEETTGDTYGKFRIKRVGNNFTFYTWNNVGENWNEEYFAENINFNPSLYITLESETAVPGWGNISVDWDDLEVAKEDFFTAVYIHSGEDIGLHNVTFFVNDSLGNINNTQTTNFTMENVNDPPTTPFVLYPTPNSVLNNIKTITWSDIYDQDEDTLRFNITLLNPDLSFNSTIVSDYGNSSTTSYLWDTSTSPNGNYSLRVDVYENETLEGYSSSSTLIGNFSIENTPPYVTIDYPFGETFDQYAPITFAINATDLDGIDKAIAIITHPSGESENITLYNISGADNFNSNTIGTLWQVEDASIGINQNCIADIDTSTAGKAFTSILGNGEPNTDTYCSLVSTNPIYKDFDMNISFNVTSETGSDYAMLFKLTEVSSSLNASKNMFLSIGNWTGYGRTYDVFINDGNISSYFAEETTGDTYGKFRIKRVGNNFTFYTWNNVGENWNEEYFAENINFNPSLYITLESETAVPGWGNISVDWDDLEVAKEDFFTAVYIHSGEDMGLHNVTFFVNDSLGNLNNTQTTNFNIENVNDPPTTPFILYPTPNSVLNNIKTITWSDIYDQDEDTLRFNITLLNPDLSFNSTIVSDYGNSSTTSYLWDTSTSPNGNYSLRVDVYENETLEGYSSSSTLIGNFSIENTPPYVTIDYPFGETFDQYDSVTLAVNATDLDGIDKAIAIITHPSGESENITLYNISGADNFNSNTIGTLWQVEDASIGINQNCIADIDTSTAGKAYTSISGNGEPNTDTYCSLVSTDPLYSDFDMNISFNITSEVGSDYAMLFKLTEISSSLNASKNMFLSIGNWTGYGRTYDVFINDGNIADYVSEKETNDTYGKLRIKRVGNNFTFYTWDNLGENWNEEYSAENINFAPSLYITLESETAILGWGNISVTWDDLEVEKYVFFVGTYVDSDEDMGLHNVTFFVNDSLGNLNNTQTTNFNIENVNDPPTTPFILYPTPNSVLNNIKTITWSDVYDRDGDALHYNITLLNTDLSFNSTIVSNYGDSSTNFYDWNTNDYPDGNYSIMVTAYEIETPEGYSSSSTLGGNFSIDNMPPSIAFISPTPENGSLVSGIVLINISAMDANLDYISIANATSEVALCYSSFCEYSWNTNQSSTGMHTFYITASDVFGNVNTDNITFFTDSTPPIFTTIPANASLFYGNESLLVQFVGTDETEFGYYSINDTRFLINQTGFLSNATSLSVGNYEINVTINDTSNNINWTLYLVQVYSNLDLFINSSSISINESNPIENQSVEISVIVENLGYSDAENVLISFFEGDPSDSGINIGNTTINVSQFSFTATNISWNAKIGPNNIFILADYNLLINEENETNNKANKTISINSWQEIYGNASVDKIIGDEATNIRKWYNDSSLRGNVFITDSESYVSWLSLQAIGKTKEGGTSSNDFLEIDELLGMTNFEDSVSKTFSEDQNPKDKKNMLIHQKEIQDVPIIDSTNNSNFFTGILWDSSDDVSDGEYDSVDREDIVFVAEINKQSPGAYGVYDYEIKIPSKLRDYNNLDSQEIYLYYDLN